MPGPTLRNRDILRQGLDLVAGPLYVAMDSEFSRERGQDWLAKLSQELNRKHRVDPGDLGGLVGIALAPKVWQRVRHQFGSEQNTVRNHLGLLREARNLSAHQNSQEDMSPEEVLVHLHQVERVLLHLGAPLEEVASLRAECLSRIRGAVGTVPATGLAEDGYRELAGMQVRLDAQLQSIQEAMANLAKRVEQPNRADEREALDAVLGEVVALRQQAEHAAREPVTEREESTLAEIERRLELLESTSRSRESAKDELRIVDAGGSPPVERLLRAQPPRNRESGRAAGTGRVSRRQLEVVEVPLLPSGKLYAKTVNKLRRLSEHDGSGRTVQYWVPYMEAAGYRIVGTRSSEASGGKSSRPTTRVAQVDTLEPVEVPLDPSGKLYVKTVGKLRRLTGHSSKARTVGYWQPYMRRAGYRLVVRR